MECRFSSPLIASAAVMRKIRVGSRHAEDSRRAIDRMDRACVVISTAEAIAFEWCEQAGTEHFKTLNRLVRERDVAKVGDVSNS